jgi:single-strand DNA-binding protein
MKGFSTVILMGSLTRDVEFRNAGDTVVGSFGVAINRTSPSGRDTVAFVDVSMWGKRAEAFARFHKKGSPCIIQGRLDFDEWTGKDGGKRTKLYVTATDWDFVPGGKARDESPF